MDLSSLTLGAIRGADSVLGLYTLRKIIDGSEQTAAALINDMKITNAKIMENSVTPYKGTKIDIRV